MSSDIEGFLKAARKDLGYREKGGGYTKFGDWYSQHVDKDDAYFKTAPWCDMFVTWAGTQAGVKEYVGEFASTVKHATWFKKHGAWSKKPEPGAVVFYDWSGSKSIRAIDHTGIVEKVHGGTISTIEGNVDRVWLKRKERSQDKVVGYGLPRKVRDSKAALEREEKASAAKTGTVPAPLLPAVKTGASMTLGEVTAAAGEPADAALTLPGAAVPAAAMTTVLGVALVVRRVRARPKPATSAGRHRKKGRRHRRVLA